MPRFFAVLCVLFLSVVVSACGKCNKCEAPTSPKGPVELITLLNATPAEVCAGGNIQIVWAASQAKTAVFSDIGSVATSGNRLVQLGQVGEYKYVLTAYNNNGESHQKEVKATAKACSQPPVVPAVVCRVDNGGSNSTVYVGTYARLSASGGTGQYDWYASGGSPPIGTGSTFETKYSQVGVRTVTVNSGGQSATCNVHFVEQVVTPTPTPVNCVVSDWGPWSAWSPVNSTTEQRSRTRSVVTPASNGGQSCPALTETETRTITPPVVCQIAVEPSATLDHPAGSGAVSVTTSPANGCSWTATGDTSWLSIGTTAGNGSDQLSFSVSANSGTQRQSVISVRLTSTGQVVTSVVTQKSPPAPTCQVAVQQSVTTDATNGGGSVSVTVSGSGCSWTATSETSWVTLRAGSSPGPALASVSGTVSGSIYFATGNNGTGAQRTGTIRVVTTTGTFNVTITQRQ